MIFTLSFYLLDQSNSPNRKDRLLSPEQLSPDQKNQCRRKQRHLQQSFPEAEAESRTALPDSQVEEALGQAALHQDPTAGQLRVQRQQKTALQTILSPDQKADQDEEKERHST